MTPFAPVMVANGRPVDAPDFSHVKHAPLKFDAKSLNRPFERQYTAGESTDEDVAHGDRFGQRAGFQHTPDIVDTGVPIGANHLDAFALGIDQPELLATVAQADFLTFKHLRSAVRRRKNLNDDCGNTPIVVVLSLIHI